MVDLFAPWREAAEVLRARHVGRTRELEALVGAARAFLSGGAPLPIYLFGPHGVGKSHVLALARAELDGAVSFVSEDVPAQRSARDLLARWLAPDEPRWLRWKETPRVPEPGERRVLLIDGLDRQLHALGLEERRELRRLLDARSELWIAASGSTLIDELTGRDEAFFGAFDPWPLDPLLDDDARKLLDTHGALPPLRGELLVTLAGGQPRLALALGMASGSGGGRLVEALVALDGEHGVRLRELSPQGQQMVELFGAAPRELTPTELAEALGASSSHMSVQAGRLESDGVLQRRTRGRQAFYRLVDPAYRYWLEGAQQPWHETRAAVVARLLEVEAWPAPGWWEPPPKNALERRWQTMEPREALFADVEMQPAARRVVWRALEEGLGELAERLWRERLAQAGLADMLAILDFDAHLRHDGARPGRALSRCLEALRETECNGWTGACLATLLGRVPDFSPDERQRRALAELSFVRARFYAQGPRAGEPAWFDLEHDEGPDVDHRVVAAALRGDDEHLRRAAPA
ncbi:MAG TPA: hypothetical protein VFB62_06490, partial [Polyangiaceae bacterium]|nr:hypothetical protein [Polyangiaceae bacterium]